MTTSKLNNIITEIKIHWMLPRAEWRWQEKESMNLKDKSIEVMQSEKQREKF